MTWATALPRSLRIAPKALRSLIYETSPKYYPALDKTGSRQVTQPLAHRDGALAPANAHMRVQETKALLKTVESNPLRFGSATGSAVKVRKWHVPGVT